METLLQYEVENWMRENRLTRGEAAVKLKISYPVLLSILRGEEVSPLTESRVRTELNRPDREEVRKTVTVLTEYMMNSGNAVLNEHLSRAVKWLLAYS